MGKSILENERAQEYWSMLCAENFQEGVKAATITYRDERTGKIHKLKIAMEDVTDEE